MKLIVGLGNPGPRYKFTRHNIGYMLVDLLAYEAGVRAFKNELKAETAKVPIRGETVLLAKPQTFMNLSGDSVRALLDFYKVNLGDLLVIQDDIDQPLGQIRFHTRRGHGGHNGIRHLHQILGTDDYSRLKLGVGRPSHPGHDVADYVLADFSKNEEPQLQDTLALGHQAVEFWCENNTEKAANVFNSQKLESKS